MRRHERRLMIDCLGVGVALTLLVIAADASGLLAPLENWLYDTRALLCQSFTPSPTKSLVHLDIDDPALDVIGRWPWPRGTLAEILDELRLAAPKAIEMDILLSERQELLYLPTTAPSTLGDAVNPSATQPINCLPIDNDARLADVLRKLDNVILPATLEPIQRESPRYTAMVKELQKDLEQDEAALVKVMREQGFEVVPGGLGDQFFIARRDAIMRRLTAIRAGSQTSFEQVRLSLLPNTPIEVQSGVVHVLEEQWEKFLAIKAFERFALPAPRGITYFAPMKIQLPPVALLSDAAAGGAFVDYTQFGSPVIRSLPLLLECNGKFYPQMGLALACRMMDADMTAMRVVNDRLMIPRADKSEIAIPLSPPRMSSGGYQFGNLFDIPWFGGSRWENMYDWPAQQTHRQHLPMMEVWRACSALSKLRANNRAMDDAIRGLFEATEDVTRFERYNNSIPAPDDYQTREKQARFLLEDFAPFMDVYASTKPTEMERKDEVFVASYNALKRCVGLTPQLVDELAKARAALAANVGGKAVLIGWTATAAVADFVPTSLHEKAPGPVVHGVVFNGIMTGELWTRWPWSVAAIATGVIGLLTAIAVGYYSPLRALLLAVGLFAGYAILNGTVFFDFGNRIVGAAGPLTAIAVAWGGCTLTRVAIEATERARITRRFSTYASPRLVDYVLEHPEIRLDGENREMSIVYTDLVGFTTLSEKLGEKIVPVLNELLGELVPIVEKDHNGLINKFLGDGIMFFFNAPELQDDHAARAVSSVLAMHKRVEQYNSRLRERGLPELAMRAGIASGVVIVGDAGMEGRSDYTVLGDSANLGSRLEAANKQIGTHSLMNDRVRELLNDEFLIRPIGRIKVVGKDEAIMCHEPMAPTSEATDRQRELARRTKIMVEAFIARRFEVAARAADEMDQQFGPSKLTAIYRGLVRQNVESPPADDFDGRIVLTEK